ncbi:MAG: flagellar motor switch protein FliN [Planctomycetota bacterium]
MLPDENDAPDVEDTGVDNSEAVDNGATDGAAADTSADTGATGAGTDGAEAGGDGEAGAATATEAPPADQDSEVNAEETEIRQELGIGNAKIEVNQQVIDELLQGAVVGYERIFDDTVLGGGGLARDYGIGLPGNADATPVQENLSLLRDVHMNVKVELGRGHMYLKDILRLGQGSVVELERLAGDPLDIYVNDKVIARGEVLVLNENFCIRITEIFNPADVLKE